MTPTNTEALAALSYAEAAKLLADELEYKYQRGIDPHDGEWRNAVTLLHRLSAVEAERDALRADAERYRALRDDEAYPYAICIWDQEDGYAQDARSPAVVDAAIDAAMKGTQ